MKKLWEKYSKNNTSVFAAVVIIILAVFLVLNPPQPNTSTSNQTAKPATASSQVAPINKPKTLAYKGEDGKTALALLQEKATVEISGTGEMAFVTSINGYKPDVKKEYWSFYINGKASQVGAGSYQTKNTDLIEWKLEAITPQ